MKRPRFDVLGGLRSDSAGSGEDTLALSICAAFGVVVVTYLLARFVIPALHIRQRADLTFFPEYYSDLSPEPVAQQQFLLIAAATVGLPVVIALVATRGRSTLSVCRRIAPILLLGFLVLMVVAFVGALPQDRLWWPSEMSGLWVLVPLGLLAGYLLSRWKPLGKVRGVRWETAIGVVLLCLTILFCLAGFYTDHTLTLGPTGTLYHVPFTFEEVYAVVGGHTPLVDWVPQYVTIIPYLLAPMLSLRAPSIGMFTASMTLLSVISFMCGYFALRVLTRRAIPALVLFLLVLAMSLVPNTRAGDQVFTADTYFAIMPLRYGGPLVCFAAVVALARWQPRAGAWLLFGVLEGFVVLNNFEFGLPAAVAGAVAGVVSQNPGQAFELRRSLRSLVLILAGVAAAVALFTVVTVLRSGQLPNFGDLVWFNREFAIAGFLVIPLHGLVTLQGLVFVTFVAAVALGIAPALLGLGAGGIEGRVSAAALTFTGIFGVGAFAYYANGRSLPAVLGAQFCAWGFALAALSVTGLRYLRQWRTKPMAAVLGVLPVLALAFAGAGSLLQDDYPFQQPGRVLSGAQGASVNPVAAIAGVRTCVRPGTNMGVLLSYGLRIAIEGHVHDWFPYNNPGDLATVQQVDATLVDLRRHNARVIMSQPLPADVSAIISRAGFRPVYADTPAGAEFWVRGSARLVSCK
jgi:hypothetical protein